MTAKLQKQQIYKYEETLHFEDAIAIPDEAIIELYWKGGQELELGVKNSKLIAKKRRRTVNP